MDKAESHPVAEAQSGVTARLQSEKRAQFFRTLQSLYRIGSLQHRQANPKGDARAAPEYRTLTSQAAVEDTHNKVLTEAGDV